MSCSNSNNNDKSNINIPIQLFNNIFDYLTYSELDKTIKYLEDCEKYEKEDIKLLYELKMKIAKRTIHRFLKKVIDLKKSCDENFLNQIGFVWDYDLFYPHLSKRLLILSYFFFYSEKYIKPWYFQFECNWKREILEKYNRKKYKHNIYISRFDLYNLQKQMNYDEITILGW